MTGSAISMLGVCVSVLGALLAGYGSWLSSQENKSTSARLLARTEDVAAKSDEIAKLNRENAELSKKFAAYAMGADSYFYLHVRDFGKTSRTALLKHIGANPVRDTEIQIFDITDRIPDLAARRTDKFIGDNAAPQRFNIAVLYPVAEGKKLSQPVFEGNPTKDSYAYFIYLAGANATYRQVIQLVRVGDTWRQAYSIDKVAARDTYEPIGQHLDEGFPNQGELIVRADARFPRLE